MDVLLIVEFLNFYNKIYCSDRLIWGTHYYLQGIGTTNLRVSNSHYFYDIIKATKPIKSINNKHGFSTEFVIRKADQGNEGSCVAAAFMRVLMLAQYGKEGATMPIPCYYAILAQRLISMYR